MRTGNIDNGLPFIEEDQRSRRETALPRGAHYGGENKELALSGVQHAGGAQSLLHADGRPGGAYQRDPPFHLAHPKRVEDCRPRPDLAPQARNPRPGRVGLSFPEEVTCIFRKKGLPLQRISGGGGCHRHILPRWKGGRVVDYSGLENRRTETYRGFESLPFRKFGKRYGNPAIPLGIRRDFRIPLPVAFLSP